MGTQRLLSCCFFVSLNTKVHLNVFSLQSPSSNCWDNRGLETMVVTMEVF